MPASEELDPGLKQKLISRMKSDIPFWTLLGMEIVDVAKGRARLRIPFSKRLTNANGVLHGGVIFSAADSATGVALIGLLTRDEKIATLEVKINYLRPVDGRDIFAEARIVHRGSQTAVGEVSIEDADGRLAAKALATYAVSAKSKVAPGGGRAEDA
jgi:acyl-CoA thioesterase